MNQNLPKWKAARLASMESSSAHSALADKLQFVQGIKHKALSLHKKGAIILSYIFYH